MNRILFFYIFFSLILGILIIFQWIIYKRWSQRLKEHKYFTVFSFAYVIICLLTHIFLIFAMISRKKIVVFYDGIIREIYFFILSWQYSFFFSFFLWIFLITFFGTFYYAFQYWKKVKKQHKNYLQRETEKNTKLITRKTFLMTSVGTIIDTTPFFGATINYIGIKKSNNDFQVFEKNISIRNLHKNFAGFRIVQISDIHIGSLIHENYLKPTIEIIKNLKPDIIAVTGDILDNSNQYLNVVGWYFRKLNEIAPVYSILGNHDHIDKTESLVNTLRKSGSMVLINDFTEIRIEKEKLNLIGLDYPMVSFDKRIKISENHFNVIYQHLQDNENPLLVLTHHPGDFHFLKKKKVDLVLAGHTHGGQILFSKNRESKLALGSHFAKYYIDLYEENGSCLYVNRGLGHWFPLRVNCPPEITLIILYESA